MDMEILPDYLVEAREMLERAQEGTLLLEGEPSNTEALASVFRAVHTIKGGASFLEVGHLVDWAHHLESLLDKLRSGSLGATPDRIDAVLKGLDVIERMLQELAQAKTPAAGPTELGQLIQTLTTQEGARRKKPARCIRRRQLHRQPKPSSMPRCPGFRPCGAPRRSRTLCVSTRFVWTR